MSSGKLTLYPISGEGRQMRSLGFKERKDGLTDSNVKVDECHMTISNMLPAQRTVETWKNTA